MNERDRRPADAVVVSHVAGGAVAAEAATAVGAGVSRFTRRSARWRDAAARRVDATIRRRRILVGAVRGPARVGAHGETESRSDSEAANGANWAIERTLA